MEKAYTLKNGQISFGRKKLKDADISTFEALGNNFAKDNKHFYYNGTKTELNPFDFEFCGDRYIKDKDAIYCILKTKLKRLKADPATFESLGGGFARDKSNYFCKDNRIRVKDKMSFRVIDNDYAVDEVNLYYQSVREPLEFTPDSWRTNIIPCAENVYCALIVVDRNVILKNGCSLNQVRGADPASIDFINEHYLVDKNYFYYWLTKFEKNVGQRARPIQQSKNVLILDDKVFLHGRNIANLDGTTFRALGNYYFDTRHIVCGKDIHNIVKFKPAADCIPNLSNALKSIKEILKIVFCLFDNYCPMMKLKDDIKNLYHSVQMPAYSIEIKNSLIQIRYEKQVISGKISAFMLLGSEFWSIARNRMVNRQPIRRLLYNSRDYDDGYYSIDFLQKIAGEHFAAIAAFFYSRGENEEALLIAHKLYRDLESVEENRSLELLRICPYEILSQMPLVANDFSMKTTNLARAKEILPFLKDKDLFRRLHYAREMFGLIAATGNIDGFYRPILLPLIDYANEEKNEHIQEILFECLDLAVTIYFRRLGRGGKKDVENYQKSYPILHFLLAHYINADLNVARLWECAHVINTPKEISDASTALKKLVESDDRAPGMWWTEYPYPNYEAWMTDARLRLGYLLPKEQAGPVVRHCFEILNKLRLLYNAHAAGGSIAEIQMNIVNLCKVHHIDIPFEDYTYQESCSGYSNLHRTIHNADFIVTDHRILHYGSYRLKDPNISIMNLELVKGGSVQTISLSDYIGIDYLLEGQPWGRQIKSQVTVYHPNPINGVKATVYPGQFTQVGIKSSFYWYFEKQEELQPGKWRIEITFPDFTEFRKIKFMASFDITIAN